MTKYGLFILLSFVVLAPGVSLGGGAHRAAPFEMNGSVGEFQVEGTLVKFVFSGTIAGRRSGYGTGDFRLNLEVTNLPIEVRRG